MLVNTRGGTSHIVIVVDFSIGPYGANGSLTRLLADPDAMIKGSRKWALKLMVSIWPTVDHRSENYEEMVEMGYLIKTDRGHRIAMDFHGNTAHFDPTNPGARDYVAEDKAELL